MNELKIAIDRFNQKKKSEGKQSRPYGKWNDSWNIDYVLCDAIKINTINKLYKML
jgi:hypothetical protein